ncbi:MAG: BMP family ABC transporter substrate-binding protein [Bacteroidota bacterium]
MMRRLAGALIALSGLMLLSGCGAPAPDCARPEVLCVGLVSSTAGLQDHGLNQSAWETLQQAQAHGIAARVDAIETVDARDYAKNIAVFVQDRYDVIISSGAGLRDETLQAARDHPSIRFIGLDQESASEALDNFTAVHFPEDQGGFLAGALAAQMTRTQIIGAACETAGLASFWRACEGFRLGAQYARPGVTVLVQYHRPESSEDLFTDEGWGTQAAQDMIRAGADVIFGVGGRPGEGALRAASQAGAWGIGWEQDQFYQVPDARASLLSSVVPDAAPAILQVLSSLNQAGQAPPGLQGAMDLAPSHETERFISPSLESLLADLKLALRNGSVVTNVPPQAP